MQFLRSEIPIMKKQAFVLLELSISMAVFLSTVLCVLHLWSKIEVITKEIETRISDLHIALNQLETYNLSCIFTDDIIIPNQPEHFIIKKIKTRRIELITGFYSQEDE